MTPTPTTLRSSVRTLRPATQPSLGILLPACATLGSASGAESFSAAALSRYAADYAAAPPVDLALRAQPDLSTTNVFQMLATLALRPTFVTRLMSAGRTEEGTAPSTTPAPAAAQASPGQSRHTASMRTLFERIFARETRIEAVPQIPERELLAPPLTTVHDQPRRFEEDVARRGSPPLEMVARRTLVPAPSVDRQPRTDEPSPRAPGRDARGSDVPAPSRPGTDVPFSPGDIGRLTDEVVRAIDRRIVAERERRGVI